jgi:hypothetical protein
MIESFLKVAMKFSEPIPTQVVGAKVSKIIVGVKIPIFLCCFYALEKFGKSFNHWVRTL